MRPSPLALALGLALAAVLPARALAEGEVWPEEETPTPPRLDLTLWGGQAWDTGGNGQRAGVLAGEATWRFDALDLGLFGGTYRLRELDSGGTLRDFDAAPALLVRFGQRFETRSGMLARFTFGAGALKTTSWRSWFQVAIGGRLPLGRAFVSGELSFESDALIRLSVGLGVSLL